MANLTETSTFDAGVYQIETTDPVQGGASGIINAPLKNLANRTKYLKDTLDVTGIKRGTALDMSVVGGTNAGFTGIPSWVKRITIMLSGVTKSGGNSWVLRIGDSSGYSAVSYNSQANTFNNTPAGGANTTGFYLMTSNGGGAWSGNIVLTNITGFKWVVSGVIVTNTASQVSIFGGDKDLGAQLDRVGIQPVNGSDLFTGGLINVLYE